ncbi:hypothetical protein MKW98_011442 [Papaver atlanticum]|uniref:MULE transposase domain-containing protein n=1 Tax=Papaver atlanticum TaxID=357466 RepID=A0AAD4T908_9MAGN|nr:hypothetical protein MKW98_011442 [Papaver atlanticum]
MEETSMEVETSGDIELFDPRKEYCATSLQNWGEEEDVVVNPEHEKRVSEVLKIDMADQFVTDQVFNSRDEMIVWCQDVGRQNHMIVVIAKSEKPIPGRKTRITLGCERGGVFRHHTKKDQALLEFPGRTLAPTVRARKHTGTKKCGCPFTLKGIWQPDDKWKVKVECGEHNHALESTVVGHSFAGRLKNDEKQLLKDMIRSGIKPKEVLTTLKKRSRGTNKSTMRTIYNARAHLRMTEMEGRSEMQQVMKLLEEYHYVEWHIKDEEADEVQDVIWSHPDSIQLAKSFPSVLMINSMYRTSRYHMPLSEIIGVTSTGRTFTVAFLFMKAEIEERYTWALSQLKTIYEPNALPSVFVTSGVNALISAIKTVFPKADHILCTFQISRTIMVSCKHEFHNNEYSDSFLKDWENLMQSETPVAFDEGFASFESKWINYPTCVQYLRDNWLGLKEYFVSAWTNKVKHYGYTTTKTIEGAQEKTSRMIGSSQGTFVSCWTEIHSSITNEITTVKESLVDSLISVKPSHNLPILKDLKNNVSHLALDMLVAEHSRGQSIDASGSSCECSIRFTHGLPCAHEIKQFEHEGRPIALSDIDPHWRKLVAVPAPIMPRNPDNLPEFDLFKQKWEISSETVRLTMLKKLKEIVTPPTTVPVLQSPSANDSVTA